MDKKLVSHAIGQLLDLASVELYAEDKPRQHLGASLIGEVCAAKIWFGFRWAKQSNEFDGKQLRLFNTGHKEEIRIIEWLRKMGFEVFDFDENGNQFRITACNGHFGGSLDSGAIYRGPQDRDNVPKHYREFVKILDSYILNLPILTEYKTHNAKNFAKLAKHGVEISFPKHYTQMSTYGTFYNLQYSLYMGYCKNDDSLWPELVENDAGLCQDMVRKADEVIHATSRPNRIAENPTYYECTYCTYKGICHHGEGMEQNCRSCRHASAVENKRWYCSFWENLIPDDFIPQGCNKWAQVNV